MGEQVEQEKLNDLLVFNSCTCSENAKYNRRQNLITMEFLQVMGEQVEQEKLNYLLVFNSCI